MNLFLKRQKYENICNYNFLSDNAATKITQDFAFSAPYSSCSQNMHYMQFHNSGNYYYKCNKIENFKILFITSFTLKIDTNNIKPYLFYLILGEKDLIGKYKYKDRKLKYTSFTLIIKNLFSLINFERIFQLFLKLCKYTKIAYLKTY